MHRDLEKDLIEIESAIKSNKERGNTFTVSVLQQAYKRLKDTQWISCSGCSDCKHKECEHYGKV